MLAHQCLPFLCTLDARCVYVKKMVKELNARINTHGLEPGVLLLFSTLQTSRSYYLGVVLHKPITHMLVEATVRDDQTSEAEITLQEDGSPRFLSSHELFLEFLQALPVATAESAVVDVEAWNCQVFLHQGHQLKSNPDTLSAKFRITAAARSGSQKAKAEAVKLPFGLQPDRKPRKRKAEADKKTVAAKRKAKRRIPKPVIHEELQEVVSRFGMTAALDPQRDSGDDINAQSEPGSDGGNDTDVTNADVNEYINVDEESEIVAPASSGIARAESEVPAMVQEVAAMDELRETVAEEMRTNMPGPASSSSYFSKQIGMHEVAFAPTGRSTCLHCKTLIQKGTIRFSWHFSTVRPPGWLHSGCVCNYSKRNSLVEKTIAKMEAIVKESGTAGFVKPSAKLPATAAEQQRKDMNVMSIKLLDSLKSMAQP